MKKLIALYFFFLPFAGTAQTIPDSVACKILNDKAMAIYLENPDQALQMLIQAEVKAKTSKSQPLTGLTKGNLAILKRMKGDYLESKSMSLEALKLVEQPEAKAAVLNNLGACNRSLGFYNEAIKNYLEALKIHEKLKDQKKQGIVENNIGMVFSALNQMDKAKLHHNRALEIFKTIRYRKGLSESYNNIAIALANQDSVPKALTYFRKSLAIEETLNDKKGIAESINNIGGAHFFLGTTDSAIYYFKKSAKIELSLKNHSGVAQSNNNIAVALLEKKQYKEAKKFTDSAYSYSLKSRIAADIMFSLQNYIEYYEATGNYLEANNFNKKYFMFKDSIEAAANIKDINELETKYETNKKEKLLAENKATLLEKDIAIEKAKNIMMAIIALAFFIGLIGYLIYRQQKLKNKQQKQEFELKSAINQIETQNQLQEQRLTISRDLHDNIGAQLTFIISSVDNVKYAFDVKNAPLGRKLDSISNFTRDTIIELRDTIWAMNNNHITFEDLKVRILNFIEKAKLVKQYIHFKFAIDDALQHTTLSAVQGMNIYRAIQEALNNAIKYAEASEIIIDAQLAGHNIKIMISDNGKGFEKGSIQMGNGLQNMQKRIEEIEGNISIDSMVHSGTKIEIIIPREQTKMGKG